MQHYGVIEYAAGDIFDGEIKDSVPYGYGITRMNCGDIHEGNYVNNERQGYGSYFWKSTGQTYKGEWVKNCQHGIARLHHTNGQITEVEYNNGTYIR